MGVHILIYLCRGLPIGVHETNRRFCLFHVLTCPDQTCRLYPNSRRFMFSIANAFKSPLVFPTSRFSHSSIERIEYRIILENGALSTVNSHKRTYMGESIHNYLVRRVSNFFHAPKTFCLVRLQICDAMSYIPARSA